MLFCPARKTFHLSVAILVLLVGLGASTQLYIVDLKVLEGEGAVAPSGFTKLEQDLNEGAGGKFLNFAIKQGTSKNNAIRDIMVIYGPNANLPIPTDYKKVLVDLNSGANGDYIYAVISKEASKGNPIINIAVLSCDANNEDCLCFEEDMYKVPVDLNRGAGGKYIYLCFRRGLE